MNEFGEQFRRCRIAVGPSQSEAAELAGVSQQSISSYESGSRVPLAGAITENAPPAMGGALPVAA